MQYSINYSYHAVHGIIKFTYFITGSLYLLTPFIHFTHSPYPTHCLWQPPTYSPQASNLPFWEAWFQELSWRVGEMSHLSSLTCPNSTTVWLTNVQWGPVSIILLTLGTMCIYNRVIFFKKMSGLSPQSVSTNKQMMLTMTILRKMAKHCGSKPTNNQKS